MTYEFFHAVLMFGLTTFNTAFLMMICQAAADKMNGQRRKLTRIEFLHQVLGDDEIYTALSAVQQSKFLEELEYLTEEFQR